MISRSNSQATDTIARHLAPAVHRLRLQAERVRSWRPSWHTLAIVLILIAGFWLRIAAYDNPLGYNGGDGYDDFLVASHIVHYHELPIFGPGNDFFPDFRNSATYYYVLAAFIAIWNTPAFLYIVFALLQMVVILGIYAIAEQLFDPLSGIIAAASTAFAPSLIFAEAAFVWQPYVMEPFCVASIYLFVRGMQRRSQKLLLWSLTLMLTALAIHLSILAILPIYGIALQYCLYKISGIRSVLIANALGFSLLVIFFALPLIHPASLGAWHTPHLDATFALNPITFLGQAGNALRNLLSVHGISASIPTEVIILIAFAASYLISSGIPKTKKLIFAALLLIILIYVSALSLLSATNEIWEMVPIFWAVAIVVGVLISFAYNNSRQLWPVWVFVAIVVISMIVEDPIMQPIFSNALVLQRPNQQIMDEAMEKLQHDIEKVKSQNKYHDLRFFDIVVQRTENLPVRPAIIWEPLEKDLDTQFVRVNNAYGGYALSPLNSGTYIYLVCMGIRVADYPSKDCTNYFTATHSKYTIETIVYANPDLTIFRTTRR